MSWRWRLAGLCAAAIIGSCGGTDPTEPAATPATLSASTTTAGSSSPSTSSADRTPRPILGEPDADPAQVAPLGDADAPALTSSTVPPPAPVPPTAPPASTAPPPPPPTVAVRDLPAWTGSAHPVEPDLAARMTGVSWHDGCPVPIAELRLLRLDHVGFDGHRHQGQLVVHADAADAVLSAFRRMYDARFPIQRVTLVDEAGGDDDAAMAANLTTAFNCRPVTGGTGWSEHSFGRAIDINPVQNPYISSRGAVLPPAGAAYLDRSTPAVGLIVEGDAAVSAFDAVGWHWGGRWRTIKDYQHFSASGR
jgi:hypothetical protein